MSSMKIHLLGSLIVLLVNMAAADEPSFRSIIPQPRLRLDPASRSAIPEPAQQEQTSDGTTPVMMEKVIVKGRTFTLRRNPQETEGKFTPADGGRFLNKDVGPFRVEVGLWTHIDIFDEEARFAGQKMGAKFDLLRIRW